jgi:hypothetical protein
MTRRRRTHLSRSQKASLSTFERPSSSNLHPVLVSSWPRPSVESSHHRLFVVLGSERDRVRLSSPFLRLMYFSLNFFYFFLSFSVCARAMGAWWPRRRPGTSPSSPRTRCGLVSERRSPAQRRVGMPTDRGHLKPRKTPLTTEKGVFFLAPAPNQRDQRSVGSSIVQQAHACNERNI